MDERRRRPRATCRLHCRINRGKKRILARIVDISEEGLCLYSPIRLESKSAIEIAIDVPAFSDSVVRGEVWHVRQQKIRSSARKVWVIGVVLDHSDDAYLRLLTGAGLTPDRQPTTPPAPTRTARPSPPPAATLPPRRRASRPIEGRELDELDPQVYRVRVQALTGPRTRLLTLTARSKVDAERLAARDLDPDWRVIDVYAA